MGDRGLIYIEDTKDYIYTKWLGSRMPELLQNVLRENADLWDNPESLGMLIFDEFYKADNNSENNIKMSKTYAETEKYIHISCADEFVSFLAGIKVTCSYTFRAFVRQFINDDLINGTMVFDSDRTKIKHKQLTNKQKKKQKPKPKHYNDAKFIYLHPVTREKPQPTTTNNKQLS